MINVAKQQSVKQLEHRLLRFVVRPSETRSIQAEYHARHIVFKQLHRYINRRSDNAELIILRQTFS